MASRLLPVLVVASLAAAAPAHAELVQLNRADVQRGAHLVREAGGVQIAPELRLWSVPSRALPGLRRAGVIGVAQPVSVLVDTFGTCVIPESKLAKIVQEHFDLRPKAIIHSLELKRPIYRSTASYGHFGRTPEEGQFTWEKTDRAEDLKKAAARA